MKRPNQSPNPNPNHQMNAPMNAYQARQSVLTHLIGRPAGNMILTLVLNGQLPQYVRAILVADTEYALQNTSPHGGAKMEVAHICATQAIVAPEKNRNSCRRRKPNNRLPLNKHSNAKMIANKAK